VHSLVVYYSLYGNTRRLAEAMAEVLGHAGPVQVTDFESLDPASLLGIDLVMMGSPTHIRAVPIGTHDPGQSVLLWGALPLAVALDQPHLFRP
jgi:flavorubredoxin